MAGDWVAGRCDAYKKNKGAVLKFLKEQFTGTYSDSQFDVKVNSYG